MTTPLPLNEAFRLRALEACDIMDTEADPEFDGIVDLAAHRFDAPIAFISLLDDGRQWFKSRIGPLPQETPKEYAVCAHAIMGPEVFVVPDLSRDARFADNPFVEAGLRLRFYMGAPIVLKGGFRVGTLCVCDTEPRDLPEESAVAALKTLADLAAGALQRRADASIAETARLAKEDFLALMSHECRTPLNAIIGFCEMITLLCEDDKAKEYAGHALESSRHLLGLIDRVLTFSQIENGELDLTESAVDIGALLRDAVAASRGAAKNADVTVSLDVAEDFPLLTGDRDHLSAMARCLLDNAMDAADSAVMVRAWMSTSGALRITVEDDGPGLQGAEPSGVLNPFAVGEDVMARAGEGIGLGLPLSQRLARLHGGELSMDEDGALSGLRVTIELPAWRRVKTAA
jgi:signal transduction histidine kinase